MPAGGPPSLQLTTLHPCIPHGSLCFFSPVFFSPTFRRIHFFVLYFFRVLPPRTLQVSFLLFPSLLPLSLILLAAIVPKVGLESIRSLPFLARPITGGGPRGARGTWGRSRSRVELASRPKRPRTFVPHGPPTCPAGIVDESVRTPRARETPARGAPERNVRVATHSARREPLATLAACVSVHECLTLSPPPALPSYFLVGFHALGPPDAAGRVHPRRPANPPTPWLVSSQALVEVDAGEAREGEALWRSDPGRASGQERGLGGGSVCGSVPALGERRRRMRDGAGSPGALAAAADPRADGVSSAVDGGGSGGVRGGAGGGAQPGKEALPPGRSRGRGSGARCPCVVTYEGRVSGHQVRGG